MGCLTLLPLWLLLSSHCSPAQRTCICRDQFFYPTPMDAAATFPFANSGNGDDQCEIRHTQRTASNAISYWVLQAGHSHLTGPTYNPARTHINTAQMAKSTSSFPAGYGWSSSSESPHHTMSTFQIPWTSAGAVSAFNTHACPPSSSSLHLPAVPAWYLLANRHKHLTVTGHPRYT